MRHVPCYALPNALNGGIEWSLHLDLNQGLRNYEFRALPTMLCNEVRTGVLLAIVVQGTLASPVCLVVPVGIEPTTPAPSTQRSTN